MKMISKSDWQSSKVCKKILNLATDILSVVCLSVIVWVGVVLKRTVSDVTFQQPER